MSPYKPLTRSEREVAVCIADFWDYTRIADWLGISRKTVSTHVANIADKLDNPDNLRPHLLVLRWASHEKRFKRDDAA